MARIKSIEVKARFELRNAKNQKIGISDSLENLEESIKTIDEIDDRNNMKREPQYTIFDYKQNKIVGIYTSE